MVVQVPVRKETDGTESGVHGGTGSRGPTWGHGWPPDPLTFTSSAFLRSRHSPLEFFLFDELGGARDRWTLNRQGVRASGGQHRVELDNSYRLSEADRNPQRAGGGRNPLSLAYVMSDCPTVSA
jgi:hypothetical protein